jgi:alginate O-acetyltransferase complex protein AlgI
MLFNSIDFAFFLPIVFFIYWFVFKDNLKYQNFLIVVSSYIFYGWWDWRFLSLILFSTIIDFLVGKKLSYENKIIKRKLLLILSVSVNLGFLGFFKYYNFFIDNFIDAFSFFGSEIKPNTLNIILPVGISFYTFQTLSYTIDVYRKKLKASPDFISFSAFVCFFPQLVAGPIERAKNLLPQFNKPKFFNYDQAVNGMRQILWGFFKKIVIADNCAMYANEIFNNSLEYGSVDLIFGAFFFTFQIYGDFSGYSDIAIGTAKLFGINLKQNFSTPYFSRDIAEFWRRWHISLSTWFRDYLYIPLGGSRGGTFYKIRNTFAIFLVSGLWHGANWTFVFWGALNAIYFLPLLLSGHNRKNLGHISDNKMLPTLKDFLSITSTFLLTVFAWIFFRANNIGHAFSYIKGIFSQSIFDDMLFVSTSREYVELVILLFLIFTLLSVEWFTRGYNHPLEIFDKYKTNKIFRYITYLILLFIILIFGAYLNNEQFIYFQF